MPCPTHLFLVALLFCGRFLLPALAASDLVLPAGYRAVEVSRDESRYMGNLGLFIHEGNDHLHDPCMDADANPRPGVRFTTSRRNGNDNGNQANANGNGFLVVNDCQIIACRKWTSPDDGDGDNDSERYGGETIVYDIVLESDDDDDDASERASARAPKWRVQEGSDCSCGSSSSSNCYVGLFLLVDDYSDDCEVGGSPGSISCTAQDDSAPRPWTFSELGTGINDIIPKSTDDLSQGAKAGIAVAAGVFALMVLYCCCCRRRKKKKNDQHDDNDDIHMEQGRQQKKAAAASTNDTGWFTSRKNKKNVIASSRDSVDTEEDSQEENIDEGKKNSKRNSSQEGKMNTSSNKQAAVEKKKNNETKVADNTEAVECNCWCT